MTTGRLESINTSRGGVPKISVFEALVTEHGGGPDRAVVIFSLDLIRRAPARRAPDRAGPIGENLTVTLR